MIFDIAQGLRNVQGMSAETVRKILETSRATFEQLAASAPDNLPLQRSRAAMLIEFGETYQTLGDLEQALAAYRDSLAIHERLAAGDRGNTDWQRDLSVSYNRIGDVLVAQGKLDEALKAYRDGLDIAEGLTAADPGNTKWQRDLSVWYDKIGDVLVAQGRLGDALKAYRAASLLPNVWRRPIAAMRNGSATCRCRTTGSARCCRHRASSTRALKAYRDGLAIAERLAAADRGNTQWQRDLSVSYDNVGNVLAAQGSLDDALKAYRDSLVIRERLAAADRSNTQWQHDLSVSYDNIGDVLVAQDELDDALKAYRDSLAIRERLAAADRSNTEWQRDLSVSYEKVGDVLMAQEKSRRCAQGLSRWPRNCRAPGRRGSQQHAMATRPRDVTQQSRRRAVGARQLDDALHAYLNGRGIAGRLAGADPSNTQWQRDLSLSQRGPATYCWPKAISTMRSRPTGTASLFVERLAAADPSNTQWQRDLSISYNKVGDVLMMQGKLDDALKVYRDGLAIRQRLAAADRSNAQWQRDLQTSVGRIGNISYRFVLERNFEMALASADQAVSLRPMLFGFTRTAHTP